MFNMRLKGIVHPKNENALTHHYAKGGDSNLTQNYVICTVFFSLNVL